MALLIDRGAAVDKADREGRTSLYAAALVSNITIVVLQTLDVLCLSFALLTTDNNVMHAVTCNGRVEGAKRCRGVAD